MYVLRGVLHILAVAVMVNPALVLFLFSWSAVMSLL